LFIVTQTSVRSYLREVLRPESVRGSGWRSRNFYV